MPDDSTFHNRIGTYLHLGHERPFLLSAADRRQHLYTLGKTGSGKTSLLRLLISQDIEAGRGVGVIDPHGDLAEAILDDIPPHRADDLVYFNPADIEHPIGLNLLRPVDEVARPIVASGVLSAFHNLWSESWGPRLEYILYATIAALLDCQNVSLLCVPRMLSDHHFRAWVVRQVKDPIVRQFWEEEYASYDRRFLQEAIAPIQNKVGQLLMAPTVRNSIGQVRTKIDARYMMDDGRIFVANLSKGRLGEDKTRLLGSLLSTWFATAAMSRSDTPEHFRNPFYLYIDEFQNFATKSFASILSEARKYRLSLTLSHQYIGQLTRELRDAVIGNAGTIMAFRVGEADAEVLAREYGLATGAGLTNLARGEVYAKTIRDGNAVEPFIGTIAPPEPSRYGRREALIARSRQKYATPRARVEDKVRRWLEH